ncbi:hypothetical protein [Sphingobium chungbukense]|uniref:Uncharacterized protein n=1 Tax=Sphingobium chungbukense TaxID=56193 RepID=A0A0M3AS76_9SPHN|nr:hypothetical protein [Sphingobium chungbukense]KKW92690.1 hypothetical protein YP76_07090 [Sphingobium chungbukense]
MADDGWEDVTDPAEIKKVLGLKAAQSMLGGGGKGDDKTALRANGLDALASQVDRVYDLYQQNVRGGWPNSISGRVPSTLRPENSQFESAGAGLSDQALAAFRVPGVGAQSDRELESFIAANQPLPTDSDLAIEEKLSNIRRRVDAQRNALGMTPWSWKGAADSAEKAPQDKREDDSPPIIIPKAAGEAGRDGATGPGPAGPSAPTISPDGSSEWSTDADKAFAAEAQAAFNAGANREQLDAIAEKYGTRPFGPELEGAIRYRDGGGKGVRFTVPTSGRKDSSWIGALGATPYGTATAEFLNSIVPVDEVAGLIGGEGAAKRAQDAKEAMREAHPIASIIGGTAGGLAATVPAARGLRAATGLSIAKSALAADAAYGAASGALENNDDRLTGAALGGTLGALGNLGGQAVNRVVSRTLSPAVAGVVKTLTDKGVNLTPGQIAGQGGWLGRVAKGVEDRLSGIPLAGESVNTGRRAAIEDMNRVAIDEALAPIGAKLPKDVATGHDAVAWGQRALSDAYDNALGAINALPDNQLTQDVSSLYQQSRTLPKAQRETFDAIAMGDVLPFLQNGNGALAGRDLQSIKRGLDSRISKARSSSAPADDLLADRLEEMRAAFFDFAGRADPANLSAYKAADDAYANFVAIERAAAKGKGGVYSPEQLRTAVRQSDRSARKRATAAGGARMQEFSDAASEVLPSSVPDSGTAGRLQLGQLFLPGAAVGLGAGADYTDSPTLATLAGGAGALSAIYSRPGRKVVQSMMTERPQSFVKLGDLIGGRQAETGQTAAQLFLKGSQ